MTVKFSLGKFNNTIVRVIFESETSVQVVDFEVLQPIHFGKNEEFTRKYIDFRRKIFNGNHTGRNDVIEKIKDFESKFTDEQKLLLECME